MWLRMVVAWCLCHITLKRPEPPVANGTGGHVINPGRALLSCGCPGVTLFGPCTRKTSVSLPHFLVVTLVLMLGALLQGSVGFGMGLFSVPLLLLFLPQAVPGPVLFASGLLTILMLFREHPSVRRADLRWSLGGRVVGTGLALAVLVVVPASALSALFGGLILVAVALTASGLHPGLTPRTLVGAGMASGFLATTIGIGGPPMALIYQRETGPSIRATLSAFFLVGTILSLAGLHYVGHFGLPELWIGVQMLPGIGLGFLASRRLAGVLDRGFIRPAILVISAVTALVALFEAF